MNMAQIPGWLVKLAPTVASAFGSPLAGMAVTALEEALGMPGAGAAAITKTLESGALTSEQIAAIKVAELNLKQHESDNGFKFAELEIRDRESARSMQMANKSWTPEVISWIIIGATMGLEGYVLVKGLPTGASEMVMGRILGTLDVAFVTVLTFWLGTSNSSRVRDGTIAARAAAA